MLSSLSKHPGRASLYFTIIYIKGFMGHETDENAGASREKCGHSNVQEAFRPGRLESAPMGWIGWWPIGLRHIARPWNGSRLDS